MTVTDLEYHEAKEKPYLVEGKTTTPSPSLNYKLACKRGGASLQVGQNYKVSDTRNDDDIKILIIELSLPDQPDVIGVECEVVSVRIASKQSKR